MKAALRVKRRRNTPKKDRQLRGRLVTRGDNYEHLRLLPTERVYFAMYTLEIPCQKPKGERKRRMRNRIQWLTAGINALLFQEVGGFSGYSSSYIAILFLLLYPSG